MTKIDKVVVLVNAFLDMTLTRYVLSSDLLIKDKKRGVERRLFYSTYGLTSKLNDLVFVPLK